MNAISTRSILRGGLCLALLLGLTLAGCSEDQPAARPARPRSPT